RCAMRRLGRWEACSTPKQLTDDSTAKRLLHREAREDHQENAKSQIIIQDNLRQGLFYAKD
ncbi:MAG TPA: hypothetical protein VLM78_00290, partial [Anaerolineales bacterium]|nr:hypothetical protein [Anaerolineales bacterium]